MLIMTRKQRLLLIILFIVILLFIWGLYQLVLFPTPSTEEIDKLEEQTLAKIEALPDNEINLGETALVFAKRRYPRLNVKKYLTKLDTMADEIKAQIGYKKDPEEIIKIINSYLFEKKKLTPLFAVRNRDELLEQPYLNRVLDSMNGFCFGLSTLYLALAERIHLPIYGVRAHNHCFVRYDDGIIKRNIETLAGGSMLSQDECEKQFEPHGSLKLSPEITSYVYQGYFVNLSKKEIITQLLAPRVFYYYQGDKAQALADFDKMLSLSSTYPNIFCFLVLVDFSTAVKDHEFTLSCIDKMTKRYPKQYHTYLQRLLVHLEGTHELDKALQDAHKALELNQIDPQIYHNRGRVYYAMSDTAKALNDFDKAVELSPVTYKYLPYFYQAKIMFERGDRDQALNLLWSIIIAKPNYAPAYYLRAKIYLEAKQYFYALQNFKEYIKLSSDSSEAREAQSYIRELEGKLK